VSAIFRFCRAFRPCKIYFGTQRFVFNAKILPVLISSFLLIKMKGKFNPVLTNKKAAPNPKQNPQPPLNNKKPHH